LATVPRPTFPEKNSEISHKIDFLLSYKNFPLAKKVEAMRADALYKWAKVQSPTFSFRSFRSKNRVFPAKPMRFRETLKTESVILTPPQKKMFAENQEIGGLQSDVTLRHDLAEHICVRLALVVDHFLSLFVLCGKCCHLR